MKKLFQTGTLLTFAALILAVGYSDSAKGGPTTTPATAEFMNRAGDKILGDLGGAYYNGTDCVISQVYSSGLYLLRTISPTPHSTTPCSGKRYVVLDFSVPVPGSGPATCSANDSGDPLISPLNICGSNSTIPDVRLLAYNMFSETGLTSGATVVLPFSLDADFKDTDFELNFEQALPVSLVSGGRTVTASSTSIAELYQYVSGPGGKVIKSSLGRYYMPFELTVTEP